VHIELSVVVPVRNEAENVLPLAREIADALAGSAFELIFVDDASTDETARAVLAARSDGIPQIRLVRHSQRGGQSAAICNGVRYARAEWVATLDGDGQNDPADLPKMLGARFDPARPRVRLVVGNRVTRRDTWFRRLQSRVANGVRRRLLGDGTPDTGCGIKLIHRQTYLTLPEFDHMHRFLPALFQRAGAQVISVPVNHRPRLRGASKYGIFDRLWVGIVDLFGVMWLKRRYNAALTAREEIFPRPVRHSVDAPRAGPSQASNIETEKLHASHG
jgi:dolichol-phosphate mannosyltransferase